jgi:hypothetical protein
MNRPRQLLQALLDHRFGLVAAPYIIAVIGSWHFGWTGPSPDRDYVAARDLVNNHRVTSTDLQTPSADPLGFYMESKSSLEGKYIWSKKPIKGGERISHAVLADEPDMQFPNTIKAIAFPLPAGAIPIGELDAGSKVLLVGQDADSKCPISIAATVQAIYCEPKKGEAANCYPLLRIPANKIQIVSRNQSALHLVLSSDANP